MATNSNDFQKLHILKEDDVIAFKDYIQSELSHLEKHELQNAVDFYLDHVSK